MLKHQDADRNKSLPIINQKNAHGCATVIPRSADLPVPYDKTYITVMIRDPYCIYCYWEISPGTIENVKKKAPSGETVLRIFDITGIVFNGTNAHRFFDIPIESMLGSKYITMSEPNKTICIELGLRSCETFTCCARSRCITTPRASVSETIDADWKMSDEKFSKIYALSSDYGTGLTSSAKKHKP